MESKKKESMNSTHRAKIGIIIAFLLSLLFHISSVLYVLWQRNSDSREQSSQEKEEALIKEIKKREEWVETKARASNFGAPVMFQDEPSYADPSETQEQPEDKHNEIDPNPVQKPEQKIIEKIVPEKVTLKEKSVSLQKPVEEVRPKVTQSKPAISPKPSAVQTRKNTYPPQQKKNGRSLLRQGYGGQACPP